MRRRHRCLVPLLPLLAAVVLLGGCTLSTGATGAALSTGATGAATGAPPGSSTSPQPSTTSPTRSPGSDGCPAAGPTVAATAAAPVPSPPSPRGGLSGGSGDGIADGAFGRWRGTPVTVAGTWNDSLETQAAQCSVQPGAEYGAWTGDLDVAVGAIYRDAGETWEAAAAGSYDARWRAALTSLARAWTGRPGTLHVRFAHEFNGDWVPWRVRGRDVDAFVASWRRFRALQLELLPGAKLVMCPNDRSSASLGLDWRRAYPGVGQVDEMAVDSYNHGVVATDATAFDDKISRVDVLGAPAGMEGHRRFAESVGLPLALAEWGNDADRTTEPGYVGLVFDWLRRHAGTGPGQVPYDLYFNVGSYGGGNYQLFADTRQPAVAQEYAGLF